MLAILLVAFFCTIYGCNLRSEFIYAALFAVSFPLWASLSLAPWLIVALLTAQAITCWVIVEFLIRQTPAGFGLFWQIGGMRLALVRV